MYFSKYLISFRHSSIHDHTVLFSTKTGALILLPDDDFGALQNGAFNNEYTEELTELGFLVKSQAREKEEVQNYMEDINHHNPNLTVALVLGMECNFRCSYCFEGQQKGKRVMTDETANQVIDFIKNTFNEHKKKLVLQIYGGEPLLYTNRIIYLAKQLKPYVEQRGAELVIDLITNGSLLTPQVVDELNKWGLDGAKITIDGPPDNHNTFRPFKSGAPTFDVIVNNIKNICTKTKIRLGGNYTNETYQDFVTVLDHLNEKGITADRIEQVHFNIVMQVNDAITRNEYAGGCATINEPWLKEASLHIRKEVLKRGYPIADITPEPCAVEINDAYTVHYDGSLYKCVTWIGHEQYKIGDVWSGVTTAFEKSHHIYHWQHTEKCKECIYLPLCFGGCRYMAYQRDEHMGNVDCRKPYFNATLKSLLRQDLCYKYDLIEESTLQ